MCGHFLMGMWTICCGIIGNCDSVSWYSPKEKQSIHSWAERLGNSVVLDLFLFPETSFVIPEKAVAAHSSILAWKIPWTQEPGGLQPMRSLRVEHYWVTFLSLFLSCIGEGNGNPLQCSCLENPRVGGAWWAAVYGVTQSLTWLKQLSSSSSSIMIPKYFWSGHLVLPLWGWLIFFCSLYYRQLK